MAKTSQTVLAIILIISGTISSGKSEKKEHEIYRNISKFSTLIYEEIVDDHKSDSFVLSSFTIWMSLFMISQATFGETKKEILSVLNYNEGNNSLVKNLDEMLVNTHVLQSFKKNVSTCRQFNMAYMLFLHNQLTISDKFLAKVLKKSMITIDSIDLDDKKAAIKAIDYWMKQSINSQRNETNFPSINDSWILNASTGLLLVSATSFQALWKTPRNKKSVLGNFYLQDNTTLTVPMLTDYAELGYDFLPSGAAHFVLLPSTDTNISAVIILPNKDQPGNFRWIESEIESFSPSYYFNAPKVMVKLRIPKIKLATVTHVDSILSQLGIKKIFQTTTEIDGIGKLSRSRHLLPQIIHTASIEIGESEGNPLTPDDISKANGKSSGAESFKVDRPFLILVCTRDTILFKARIFDPTVTKNHV